MCDFDDNGDSDCTGGSTNCSLLYFCGDYGYVGKTGICEDAEYYGDFKNEGWHGEGVLILHPEGSVRFGKWKKGKEVGQGTLILKDGSITR